MRNSVETGRIVAGVGGGRLIGVAIDVPSQFFAGPSPQRIDRAARRHRNREIGFSQIGAGAGRALQQPPIPRDNPGIIPMVMEGMEIPSRADQPHQGPLARMDLRHAVIGLIGQPGSLAPRAQHRIRRIASIDEPEGRVIRGEIDLGHHPEIDEPVNSGIHFREEKQVFALEGAARVLIGLAQGICGIGPHDQGADQAHFHFKILLGAAVIEVGPRLTRGKRIGHETVGGAGSRRRFLRQSACRAARSGHVRLPWEDNGDGHRQLIRQRYGHGVALIHDHRRSRVLHQSTPVRIAPTQQALAVAGGNQARRGDQSERRAVHAVDGCQRPVRDKARQDRQRGEERHNPSCHGCQLHRRAPSCIQVHQAYRILISVIMPPKSSVLLLR